MALKKEPKAELVPMYIPKEGKNDDSVYIAVNGRRLLVKKGVDLMLPKMFADVIKNSRRQEAAAQRFIDANATD